MNARWERTLGPGSLLEISFESARPDPVQGLVLEVDSGHLAWDEQGEEERAIRLWADRHESVVLRVTGRGQTTVTAWHAYLDRDELEGDVVRRGDRMVVEDTPGGARLRCGGDDLVARLHVRQRARASSA